MKKILTLTFIVTTFWACQPDRNNPVDSGASTYDEEQALSEIAMQNSSIDENTESSEIEASSDSQVSSIEEQISSSVDIVSSEAISSSEVISSEVISSESQSSVAISSSVELSSSSEVLAATFTDSRDNKVYKQVQIGNQVWMGENLNYGVANESSTWCLGDLQENCDK